MIDFNSVLLGLAVGAAGGTALAWRSLSRRADKRYEALFRERKDQFISLASHYLLNPITVVQYGVQSLKEKGTRATLDEREQYINMIERGEKRLWIITQQIILVGEIDAGKLHMQYEVVNVTDLIGEAIGVVDPFAREKNIKLHYEELVGEVREARVDGRRLKQALIALLDNAVKFSMEGTEVWVKLSLEGGYFSVSVRDTGIGMEDTVLKNITDKFYRGTSIYTFDYEGIGLGLYIAKAIMSMHHGRLALSSKPRKGTTAVLEFPNL